MELRTNIQIEIDGEQVLHFNSFTLSQKFNEHHSFELTVNYDAIEQSGSHKLNEAQKWVGAVLISSFDNGKNNFRGIVCEVGLVQNHGLRSNIVVSGYSCTVLLEGGAAINSFSEMNLQDIASKVASPALSGYAELKANTIFKGVITYQTQFKESDFAFLNRLATEYGEWFYYDGTALCFGKPGSQTEVSLVLGQNLSLLNSSLRVLPTQFSYYSYKSNEDLLIDEHTSTDNEPANGYAAVASSRSRELFNSKPNLPVKPRPENKSQLSTFIKNHQAGAIASLTDVAGQSTLAALAIGSIADIHVSLKDGLDSFKKESVDKYLITEITHYIDGLGRYTNNFKGIPADVKVIPVANVVAPVAESQIATVIDNKDPKNQGRVKVQMLWQKNNSTTDWIRVLTPDAGGSNVLTQNRGQVFIPETGDQVIVGFRYNDPNRPFVMGSIFQGSTAAGGFAQNHIKRISTRSGHIIEFDDEEATQGIKITDHHNNIIHIDTKNNNITVTAIETMTFNAKNLEILVQENMNVNVGKDMNSQISQNNKTTVGKQSTLLAQNIEERADLDIISTAKKVEKTADVVTINSKVENLTMYSGKSVVAKSVEKNKLF